MIHSLSLTLGLTGAIFLLSGWAMLKKPPGKINWLYGYRTAASMRSPERWKFAQHESAIASMQAGAALVFLAIPSLFWWPLPAYGIFLAIVILVAAVVFIFWKVQGKLRKRFGPLKP